MESSSALHIPCNLKEKWTGRDLTNCDDIGYENGLNELNDAYCSGCKRNFWMTYDCDNQNRFGSLFFREDCKEDMQILWHPQCNVCLAQANGNQNVQWQTLDGWWINWCEPFNWDIIYGVLKTKLGTDNAVPVVGFKIFSFLAVRGLCFPAQNSRLKTERDVQIKRSQENIKYLLKDDGLQQTSLTQYFPKKPVLEKKRKIDPIMEQAIAKRKAHRDGRMVITTFLKEFTQDPSSEFHKWWVEDMKYSIQMEHLHSQIVIFVIDMERCEEFVCDKNDNYNSILQQQFHEEHYLRHVKLDTAHSDTWMCFTTCQRKSGVDMDPNNVVNNDMLTNLLHYLCACDFPDPHYVSGPGAIVIEDAYRQSKLIRKIRTWILKHCKHTFLYS